MQGSMDRRSFLAAGAGLAAASLTEGLPQSARGPEIFVPGGDPVMVASHNALPHALPKAYAALVAGAEPVDAAVLGAEVVENDPTDHSVGYGGLPNELGEVELDASVMDGTTGLCGAVAALRRIRNPAAVARLVMRHTKHAMLVGEGALAFAKAQGFKEEDLLTPEAREIWMYWKRSHSEKDFWLSPAAEEIPAHVKRWFGITGTVHFSARTKDGRLGACTSTSGMAFKLAGRVGDSPIIGAGLFTDETGSAGSTGRGESNIAVCGAHTIVEAMRQGKHPTDACLVAARRVADGTRAAWLKKPDGRPDLDIIFYAVDREGRFGGASLWEGNRYAVADASGARLLDAAFVLAKKG